jgi:putative CocE/NonD family hydrolase
MTLLTRGLSRLLHLPAAQTRRLERQRDLPMELSDGTVLLADRWFPRGQPTGLPTLLMRTAYGRRGVWAFEAALLAERGYNVLVQSSRGTHGSGGVFEPFAHERADGIEAIAWLHAQPFCDGRVATWGSSYCGYTQLALCDGVDPTLLSALAPSVASADLRDLFRPYNAFTLQSMGGWIYGLDPEGRRGLLGSVKHMRAGRVPRERIKAELPVRELDVVLTGEPRDYFRDWVDHSRDDPYWDRFDARAGLRTQRAPMSFHAGWFDIFTPTQLADAEVLLNTGRDVRLTIGPWNHGGGFAMRMRDALQLFDETMKGGAARVDERPVKIQLYGDKRWWAFSGWPLVSSPLAYHLRADGGLSADAPTDPARLEWTDDPADPAPSCGGAALDKGGPVDNAVREARPDVLTFTTEPFTEDLVVIGRPRVTVRSDADVPSYDVVVRLCVVDAQGVSRNVSDGLQQIAGGSADVEIEMWPVGLRVLAGQRLRLQVAGALHPLWARNLHVAGDQAAATAGVPARQALLIAPETPAQLVLPVVSLRDEELLRDASG